MNPEEFFQEIENHLLLDEKPSEYLEGGRIRDVLPVSV